MATTVPRVTGTLPVKRPTVFRMGGSMTTFLYLITAHYLGDFALQNDFVAKFKAPGMPNWLHVMTAHCAIQALPVLLITQSPALAIGEFIVHFATDCAKCKGYIGFTVDQLIHIGCKVAWFVLMGHLV